MADVYHPSEEALGQLRETFQFLRHEREDVRKMAVHGIAEHSKDNRDLYAFLSTTKEGGKGVDTLLQYLHAGSANILGDILTILINTSAEGSCAEALVEHKVMRKAMRLLDGMEKSALPDTYVRSIEELTFMLLSNLTASHVSAVDDLLQKEDEDMRGFYLGKLQKYYDFLTPTVANAVASEEDDEKADKKKKHTAHEVDKEKEAAAEAAAEQSGRDLRKWILQILLNLTRTYDGQEMLLEDEDWRVTLNDCLTSANPVHRLLAAQCFGNCACSQQRPFALLMKSGALMTAVHRLASRAEHNPQVQVCLAEFIAGMLESAEAMAELEAINAKRLLQDAVKESRDMLQCTQKAEATTGANDYSRVEVLDDEDNAIPSTSASASPLEPHSTGAEEKDCGVLPSPVAAPPLAADVCEILEKHVLPYLDDIVDAYLAPGSDEVD